MLRFSRLIVGCSICLVTGNTLPADDHPAIFRESLLFFAGFDGGFDAVRGTDTQIRTSDSIERKTSQLGMHSPAVTLAKGEGRFGDALRFGAPAKHVIHYAGTNAGYRAMDWSGTVSFWLKLNPDRDLAPGFCDPIQITDKTWNDSAMWVDFDKELPRAFRLGVFPVFKTWNPDDTPWESFPEARRPMVPVAKPPFTSEQWTHVAFTFHGLNAASEAPAEVVLYLDGKPMGTLQRPLRMDWNPAEAAIMLGLSYTGDFDELAIFNRALTAEQIAALTQLPAGIGGL